MLKSATRALPVLCALLILLGSADLRVVQSQATPNPVAGEGGTLNPHGRIGLYLTSYAFARPDIVAGMLAAAEEGWINAVVVNAKNMHGEITFSSSVPLAADIRANTGRLDLAAVVSDLHEAGLYVIARQVLFYDPLLADYLGLAGPWVPPDDPRVQAYNLAIADEIVAAGVDEIQFDYVRYADEGDLQPGYDARYDVIAGFLEQANGRIDDRVAISVDVFGRVMWPWNARLIDPIGQSLEMLAPHVDLISPMLYPSHYNEEVYFNDPYRTIADALASGMERIDTPFRPFLQAFDLKLPERMSLSTYIQAQIQAAEDLGADGFLFWHPACEYDALYDAFRARARSSAED
ncbi:hypothetical protein JW848_09160 [Candidatus Bipolaricaulota bacterium]|nr:hypothetical protein [Candidatus Bipolaricaulota bacterium]